MPYNPHNVNPTAIVPQYRQPSATEMPLDAARGEPAMHRGPRKSVARALVVMLTAVFLATIVLRVWRLNHLPGLNGDEAWYGSQVMRWLTGQPVGWFTPTGNPINLFFVGPLAGLHQWFSPSIWLLRSVSAASGLLALVLNYVLCRKLINRRTAIVGTLLLAIAPVAIAYSRFAWDASQTPLAAVLVVYAAVALQKNGISGWRLVVVAMALALAVYIHPTNVFLLPFAAACCVPKSPPWQRRLHLATLSALVAVMLLPGFAAFAGLSLSFFSGTSVYEFISLGPRLANDSARDWLLAGMVATLILAVALTRLPRGDGTSANRDMQLLCGLSLSWLSLFLVTGVRGVQPHYERYAMWMLVPTALVLARAIVTVRHRLPRGKMLFDGLCALVAVAAVVDFQRGYFVPLLTSGGDSHLAFRTAAMDPKRQALITAQQHTHGKQPVVIVSRGWWTSQPLAYLAAGNERVMVCDQLDWQTHQALIGRNNVWFAELAGSDEAKALLERQKLLKLPGELITCTDYAGRNVVLLFRLTDCPAESLKIFSSPLFDTGRR